MMAGAVVTDELQPGGSRPGAKGNDDGPAGGPPARAEGAAGERRPTDRPGRRSGQPGPVRRPPPYPSDTPAAGASRPQRSPSPGPPGLAIEYRRITVMLSAPPAA